MSEPPDRSPADREFDGGRPTASGRSTRGNRALWIAGAVVLVVVLVVVVVVSVSGDDDSDPNGPTGVANAVVDALNAQVVINVSDEQGDANLDFDLYLTKRGSGWCADQFSGPASYTRL